MMEPNLVVVLRRDVDGPAVGRVLPPVGRPLRRREEDQVSVGPLHQLDVVVAEEPAGGVCGHARHELLLELEEEREIGVRARPAEEADDHRVGRVEERARIRHDEEMPVTLRIRLANEHVLRGPGQVVYPGSGSLALVCEEVPQRLLVSSDLDRIGEGLARYFLAGPQLDLSRHWAGSPGSEGARRRADPPTMRHTPRTGATAA